MRQAYHRLSITHIVHQNSTARTPARKQKQKQTQKQRPNLPDASRRSSNSTSSPDPHDSHSHLLRTGPRRCRTAGQSTRRTERASPMWNQDFGRQARGASDGWDGHVCFEDLGKLLSVFQGLGRRVGRRAGASVLVLDRVGLRVCWARVVGAIMVVVVVGVSRGGAAWCRR